MKRGLICGTSGQDGAYPCLFSDKEFEQLAAHRGQRPWLPRSPWRYIMRSAFYGKPNEMVRGRRGAPEVFLPTVESVHKDIAILYRVSSSLGREQ